MLSQFWPVVLDSGYIFFISLLAGADYCEGSAVAVL